MLITTNTTQETNICIVDRIYFAPHVNINTALMLTLQISRGCNPTLKGITWRN